jgi:hypothetical protein
VSRAPDPISTGAVFALLALVGFAIPVALAAAYGALDIPRADGWSYLHTLFHWHRTGEWDFNNWVSMTLVGQVLLAKPVVWVFGYSVAAVNISFALVGLGGLVALHWLGRVAGLTAWRSGLVAVVIAACPLWGPLATSFMTDVPAFAFEMLALGLACVALTRSPPSRGLLTASIVAGFVAISIRQYAVIVVAAILCTALVQAVRAGDRRGIRATLVLGTTVVVATLVLYLWWRSVPGGKNLAPRVPSIRSLTRTYNETAGLIRLTGVVLIPVLLYANPIAIVRRAFARDRTIATWTALLSAFWMASGYVPARPLVGNYFSARGVLADNLNLPGTRPRIMPAGVFHVIAIMGCIAAVVLACAAVPFIADRVADIRARRLPDVEPVGLLIGLAVAGFGVGHALALAVDEPIFDRYVLPGIPLVAILLLRSTARTRSEPNDTVPPPGRRATTLAIAGTAVLALIGAAYTAESASFDATRWEVAERAVAAGYRPEQIAAGDEWIGWYRDEGPPTVGTAGATRRPKGRSEYYEGLCVSILIDARRTPPNAIEGAAIRSHAPTRRPSPFVAYRNDEPCRTTGDGKGP